MSENVTQSQGYEPGVDWTPPMPPTDLIFDDGEPLETHRHRIAMNVLIASAHGALTGREDYFTGGNMFVYFSSEQARNRDFRGPDFFCSLGCRPPSQPGASGLGGLGGGGTLSRCDCGVDLGVNGAGGLWAQERDL